MRRSADVRTFSLRPYPIIGTAKMGRQGPTGPGRGSGRPAAGIGRDAGGDRTSASGAAERCHMLGYGDMIPIPTGAKPKVSVLFHFMLHPRMARLARVIAPVSRIT
jgi:hypothetical protein